MDNIIIDVVESVDQIQIDAIESSDIINVSISEMGIQGNPGEKGDPGTTVLKVAGEALGGHRMVTVDDQGLGKVWYAYNTNISHLHRVLGMTTGAVAEGDTASILTFGEWHSDTWNWVQYNSIYLGVNGLLTQVVPTYPDSAYLQIIGFPTSPTSMMLRIAEPIILA